MKEYASDKIRNVAVLSHDGAGKTPSSNPQALPAAQLMPSVWARTTNTSWTLNRKKSSAM